MENMTMPELVLFYNKIHKTDYDYSELQASLVCAMLSGKYKKPKEMNIDDLIDSGMVETV